MKTYSFRNDAKTIFPLFGELFIVVSIVYVIPVIVTFIYSWEIRFAKYFLIPAFILFVFSVTVLAFTKIPQRITTRQAMLFATFSWLLLGLVSTIPFITINHMSFINSLFETISAWTGTGLTVMPNIDTAPRVLIFWRSLMQWIGGMGVVLLSLLILRYPAVSKILYNAEARNDIIVPNAVNTTKILFIIYGILTAIGALTLIILGMTPFDALNYAMTGLGTGGMAPHSASVAYYHAKTIHSAIIILMILGATNFTTIYYAVTKKTLKEFVHDKQFIVLILLPLAFSVLYYLPKYGYTVDPSGILAAAFQSYSAMTCTGFNTVPLSHLPPLSKVALTFLMIIGGSSGSTAGAIKIIRFLILMSALGWLIKKNMYPESAVIKIQLSGKILKEETVLQALSYSLLYLIILSAGTIITMLYVNTSFINALFENASAIGNVGLSVGITSPAMPLVIKILFILEMLLGRLEIFTLLVAIRVIIQK